MAFREVKGAVWGGECRIWGVNGDLGVLQEDLGGFLGALGGM